jgi:AcrR family transcriptional regulator
MKAEKGKDRRVLRTRDTLGDALVELMLEKDFDEISVQEVLDRAGVGRSTFYVHYRDKDDLFLSDVEDFFGAFSSLLKRQGADIKRLAPVREFCTHVRETERFYKALVRSEKLNDVLALGRGYFARSIEERMQMAGVEMDVARRTAQAYALAGSMFALIEWWMDKGMKADAQEIDEVFHQMAWSGLGLAHTE